MHEDMNNAYKTLLGKPEEKDYLVDLDMDEQVMLKWILQKCGMRKWTELIWVRLYSVTVTNTVEKPWISLRGWEFVYQQNDYYHIRSAS